MLGKRTESIAILVHRNSDTRIVEVTSHKVVPAGGSFTLGAGRLFNQQDKDAMLDVFAGTQSALQMVPDNVIARDASCLSMIWYKKAHMATVRFRKAEYTVKLPCLVFIKMEGEPLRVFATKGNARPTADTTLYVAPLGNINVDGTMCGGNVRTKDFDGSAAAIAANESFAIEATSTHLGNANPAKGITTQDAYQEFIAELSVSGKAFPTKSLVPLTAGYERNKLTLAAYLPGGAA
ncbi:hypothetical protein QAO71_17820 (plasmid) [Halopseudomonas sp. SMJS2]|uniref:hypothetical protein n=1 Tax=Halopseudomonas sp. SMJS2 TaxID=3041098 RepID=UPI0024532FEA|nr:hypothetical protein [Halopseudomonas sp. SMJS2]WGK63400.1 hypothetical protein QAO71_17820 [Halopseudomonas sp. SMJS2]